MKYLIIVIFCLCDLVAKASSPVISENTKFCGYLKDFRNRNISVTLEVWDYTSLNSKTKSYSTTTDKGYFSFDIPLSRIHTGMLQIDGKSMLKNIFGYAILLEPKDSVFVQISNSSNDEISSVEFSGRNSKRFQFIQKLTDYGRSIPIEGIEGAFKTNQIVDYYIKSKSLLYAFVDSRREAFSNVAYLKILNCLDAVLTDCVQVVLLSNNLTDKDVAEQFEKFRVHSDLSSFNLRNTFPDIYWSLVLRDRIIIDYCIKNRIPDARQWAANNRLEIIRLINANYSENDFRDWLISEFVASQFQRRGINEESLELLELYKTLIESSNIYRKQLETILNNFNNNSVVNLTLLNTDNKIVQLGDFKGKVILLDFMFTGCSGCSLMVPHLQEIESFFAKKDIKFISISIDKTASSALKGKGKYSPKNSLLLFTSGKGSDHELIKRLNIRSYPTLTLLGRDGKIFTSRAPDPRTDEGKKQLINMIESLL